MAGKEIKMTFGLVSSETKKRKYKPRPIRYVIRDYEAGNVIDEYSNLTDARKKLNKFIRDDKRQGIYTPGWYEIYDIINHEMIERK